MKDKRTIRTDNNWIKLKHVLIIAVSLSLVVTLILFATDNKERGIEPDGSSNELTSTCRIVYDKVKKAILHFYYTINIFFYFFYAHTKKRHNSIPLFLQVCDQMHILDYKPFRFAQINVTATINMFPWEMEE